MSVLPGLREAIAWLTVVPVPSEGAEDPVPWFPWVGALLGAAGVAAAWVVGVLVPGDLGSLLAGVTTVTVWAGLTGMMHLDGLADTFDAIVGVKSRDEMLNIMRDSRIGSFGAGALALTLMASAVAAGAVAAAGRVDVLLFAPVVARWSASFALCSLPAARPEGLAARLAGRRPPSAYAATALPVVLAGVGAWRSYPAVLAACIAAIVIPRALSRRVGGLTGDIVGAAVVLVEAVALLASALSLRWILPA